MIIHIIRNNNISYNICKLFADDLCNRFSVIVRILDDETILEGLTSDFVINMSTADTSESAIIDINEEENKADISIYGDEDFINTISDVSAMFDYIIKKYDVCWVKDEKGWWYQIDRKHHGGILDIITKINGFWYCIGKDYYMKTGWVPAELVNNGTFTCLYFDPIDGHLDESKDTSDMPDPFGFPYEPIKVKWY